MRMTKTTKTKPSRRPRNALAEKILEKMAGDHAFYGLEELANELNAPPNAIRDAFAEAIKRGGHGSLGEFSTVPEAYLDDVQTPRKQRVKKIDIDRFYSDTPFLFGGTADSHLASHFSLDDGKTQTGPLWDMYRLCEREGIPTVLHGGNWVDGHCRFNQFEVKKIGVTAQIEMFINEWPYAKGVKTLFIGGDDHEGWWWQRDGLDIVEYAAMKAAAGGRDDMVFLGYVEADIALIPGGQMLYNRYLASPEERKKILGATKEEQEAFKSETGLVRPFPSGIQRKLDLSGHEHVAILRLKHGGGGTGYAKSYQPQKIINGYESGEKPQIEALGHYHKESMDYLRNCWVAQLGTTEAQSTFMRKRVIPADVGYFIFRANQASTGEINRFQHRFVPYMVRGFNFDPRAYTIRE